MKPQLPRLRRPRVSIVICNFNYGSFLDAAIRSALEQTYSSQVIVVDDGSTDSSLQVLSAWEQRIQVIRQTNQGQRAAYNTGFAHSSGEVVLFLDSDDQLHPDAVEAALEKFDQGVVKVHFPLTLIDREGTELGATIPSVLGEGEVFSQLMRHGVLYGSAPGSGNAYRRSVLELLFPLPVSAIDKVAADFFVIYGSAAFGEIAAVHRPLGCYRLHELAHTSQREEFGNAAKNVDLNELFERVYHEFHQWMAQRTKGTILPPTRLRDFSRIKNRFAKTVLDAQKHPLLTGAPSQLPELLRSLWYRSDYRLSQKVAATCWSAALLLGPRVLVVPITRYATNPASRGRRKFAPNP